ncbi:hypothetical protein [Dactylosporangium sp. NPDC051541]|uniref:hypothetical protein n=1 Tax=Dactylosporangium sp. NPDC051541 TaxID=3363977 RepID=UPI00378FFD7E
MEIDAVWLGRQPPAGRVDHLVGVDQVQVLAGRDGDDQVLGDVAARGGDHEVPPHRATDLRQLLAPGVHLGGQAVDVLRPGHEQPAAAQDLPRGVHRELTVRPHRRQEQRDPAAGGDQMRAAALTQREEPRTRDGLELLQAGQVIVGLAPPAAAAHGFVDGQPGHAAGVKEKSGKKRPGQWYYEREIDPDELQDPEDVEPAVRQPSARGRSPRDRAAGDGQNGEQREAAQRQGHDTGERQDRRGTPQDAELLDPPAGDGEPHDDRDTEQHARHETGRAHGDALAAFDPVGPRRGCVRAECGGHVLASRHGR